MKLAELLAESLVTKIEMYGAVGRVEYFPSPFREDKPYRATIQDSKSKIIPPQFVKDFADANEAEDWLQDAFERYEKWINKSSVKENAIFGNKVYDVESENGTTSHASREEAIELRDKIIARGIYARVTSRREGGVLKKIANAFNVHVKGKK